MQPDNTNPLPNFIVIGRPKSGTTALHQTLQRHPQVFLSARKELRFFICEGGAPAFHGPLSTFRGVTTLAEYHSHFAQATPAHRAVGEASPAYLHHGFAELAATAMRRHIPQARLAAIIRHPADNIRSMFQFLQSRGEELCGSIEQALDEERKGKRTRYFPGLRYLENSGCYLPLKAYFDRFPANQLRVYTYDEWQRTPDVVLSNLESFLGLDAFLSNAHVVRVNVTRAPKSPMIQYILRRRSPLFRRLRRLIPRQWSTALRASLQRWNHMEPAPMDPDMRAAIIAAKRDDIERTQELIGKDLSHWLQ